MIIFFYFTDLTLKKKFTTNPNYKTKLKLLKKCDYIKNIN